MPKLIQLSDMIVGIPTKEWTDDFASLIIAEYITNRIKSTYRKNPAAAARLVAALAVGKLYARRPTFAERVGELPAKTLIGLLSDEQKAELLAALRG